MKLPVLKQDAPKQAQPGKGPGALAKKLIQADGALRPTLEPLLHEKKNGRAQKPAVPET